METKTLIKPEVESVDCDKKVNFTNEKMQSTESLSEKSINKVNFNRNRRNTSAYILEQLTDIKDTGLGFGEKCFYWLYNKVKFLRKKWFTHCFLIIVMILYTVGGAVIFLTVEGQNETTLIEKDIQLQVRELLNDLRKESLSLPKMYSESEWKGEASRKIVQCEKRISSAFDKHPLVVSNKNTNGRVWTIWNAIVYCSTLYTTIGYGHLYPTTFTGRVMTIAYSTIGIPLFLIVLTDFGKLFTTCIKFVWSFIRRLYYTGSCRKVRKTNQMQEIFKGAQTMYEFASFRRFSMFPQNSDEVDKKSPPLQFVPEPQTPALSAFEIDDEFNLPITLALFILVTYMVVGAAIFMFWEDWTFFTSFYFVFISMSTVGFGDIVPDRPIYMILSIFYLCFGLALMSMCINVVQDKLSETFTQASTKIGHTIGVDVDDQEVECLTPSNKIDGEQDIECVTLTPSNVVVEDQNIEYLTPCNEAVSDQTIECVAPSSESNKNVTR